MTYKIVRFTRHSYESQKVIATGLTEKEAQAHCRRADTHGEGWFDSYEEELVTIARPNCKIQACWFCAFEKEQEIAGWAEAER